MRLGAGTTMGILALALTALPVSSTAEQHSEAVEGEDPAALMTEMKRALEPRRDSSRTITLRVRDDEGAVSAELTARQLRDWSPERSRTLTVVVEPVDARGSSILVIEKGGGENVSWQYVPVLGRLRQVLPVASHEAFLGTDFTYADLGFIDLETRSYELLGLRNIDGRSAYGVEETPSSQWPYSRIVNWIDAKTDLPVRRDFFDAADALWKRARFEDVKVVDGVPTPMRIVMEDLQGRTSTDLVVQSVRYDREIPSRLFAPEGLAEIVEELRREES